MNRLLTIIGARPQIIKAAAFSRAVASWNAKHSDAEKVEERILHTGQHYDDNMSGVFFEELGIPQPDYNLHVGSGSHGIQTSKMIEGIEQVLLEDKFDGVVLYGDTNSTLAGAVAASKIHIPVFHIEAGLRSFNMSMPEEVNRIVCDSLSSILFSPTKTGITNLENSGFTHSKALFKNGKGQIVKNCGDVMYDNSMYFSTIAEQKSNVLNEYNLQKNQYVLATIHRDNNTDDKNRLTSIFKALMDISEKYNQKIVLPLHPRTKKMLPINLDEQLYARLQDSENIKLIPPASFFDIIVLEKNATLVMTDSGGVQKESFFFETPCVILRPETEWVEIIEAGAGIVANADYNKIINGYIQLTGTKVHFPQLFGDGHAANHILEEITKYLA